MASLLDEIYRPAQTVLPDAVADALLALSQAGERYRLEHSRSGATGPPGATSQR